MERHSPETDNNTIEMKVCKMTDYEKKLIEAYIPSPRDKTLQDDEFYVMDCHDRVVKGSGYDLAFDLADGTEKIRLINGRGVIHSAMGDELDFVRINHLYDNKEDCKNQTHFAYPEWQKLRELQEDEQ